MNGVRRGETSKSLLSVFCLREQREGHIGYVGENKGLICPDICLGYQEETTMQIKVP